MERAAPRATAVRVSAIVLLAFLGAATAQGQTDLQLWGNLSLNRALSTRWTGAVEFQPEALVADSNGEAAWWSMEVLPNAEFTPKRWLDVIAELPVTYTRQTNEENSWDIAPRAGFRFHLFSRDIPDVIDRRAAEAVSAKERPPKRRLVVRDRLLVEQRNFFYNYGKPSSHTARLRNRLELQFPLNRARVTDNGSRTLLADWEWFVPIGEPSERFANRQRIRTGFAFRHDYRWRTELVYVWTRSRNTMDQPFSTSDHAISLTVKHYRR